MPHTLPQDVWIVDTGALDHMTIFVSTLTSFAPCTVYFNLSVVDGSACHVASFGTVKVSDLVLDSILDVPN